MRAAYNNVSSCVINYLVTIPYSLIGISYGKDKKLSVGIISEREKREGGNEGRMKERSDGESGGGMGHGGGGHGGGGMGHGGGGGHRGGGSQGKAGGNEEMTAPLNSWITVVLS